MTPSTSHYASAWLQLVSFTDMEQNVVSVTEKKNFIRKVHMLLYALKSSIQTFPLIFWS